MDLFRAFEYNRRDRRNNYNSHLSRDRGEDCLRFFENILDELKNLKQNRRSLSYRSNVFQDELKTSKFRNLILRSSRDERRLYEVIADIIHEVKRTNGRNQIKYFIKMVGVGDERDAVHDGETRRTLRSIGNKILDNIHDKNNCEDFVKINKLLKLNV